MKSDNLLLDTLNIIFLILITFFIYSLINLYCTNRNISKFTLIFTLLINNFIIINYTKMVTDNSCIENILLISFIVTIVLIVSK